MQEKNQIQIIIIIRKFYTAAASYCLVSIASSAFRALCPRNDAWIFVAALCNSGSAKSTSNSWSMSASCTRQFNGCVVHSMGKIEINKLYLTFKRRWTYMIINYTCTYAQCIYSHIWPQKPTYLYLCVQYYYIRVCVCYWYFIR